MLFVKLIEMGSTVLACPAFEEARRTVGDQNMFILVFERNRPIVDILPYFKEENILTIDDSSIFTFLRDLIRTRRRVRREGLDTAVDMEGLTRSSAVITYLMGTANRVGYHNFTSEGPYRGRLFTHEMNYNFEHHTSKMFLTLVKAAKMKPAAKQPLLKEPVSENKLKVPSFNPEQKDIERVTSLLTEHGAPPSETRLVLLNPNCSDLLPLRRWPFRNFIALGKRILEDIPDSAVVITGAPSEQEEAERIAAEIGTRCFSSAGKTTLPQLLALYSMSSALISNDSGPCHFAALTPIPIIALFGPETPSLYSPLSPSAVCITSGTTCSPCVNMLNHRFSPCTDNRCMQMITVDRVYQALRDVLVSGVDEQKPGTAS
jgi:ADP-heptose:LPS heptosyltransferase